MDKSEYEAPRLPKDHPRVFVKKEDLPALREKIKHPALAEAYAAYTARLSETVDGTLPDPSGARYTNADSHKLGVIACHAFSYLLDGDEARGTAAVSAMLTYHREVVHYDYNTEGQELFMLGLVYDWCYPLLTDAQKRDFFRAAEQTAGSMEMGYPAFSQGCVTGHGVEGQLMRDLMSVAVAMADEHPELYRKTAELFFTEMADAKKYFYTFGAYPQGSHYISYRMQWEYLATRLWDTLGIPHVYGENQKEPLFWFLYLMRGDGTFLFDGDDHKNNMRNGEQYKLMYRSFFHGAMYEGEGRFLTEALRERPDVPFVEFGNQSLNAVEYLLCADPELKPAPLEGLPLSRYFGHPRGEMIARTGWDKDAAVVQMKVNRIHTANHQHLDGGAFQIYYHGYLATDSGYYQAFRNGDNRNPASGNTNYGSQHFLSYYQRTVAHNCMLVFDPEEKFAFCDRTDISNDGGQRYPDNGREAKTLSMLLDPAHGHTVGAVLAHRIGEGDLPVFSYLKGDLAPAYTDKVEKYHRSFLFLPKCGGAEAALVVYDRIKSRRAAFRKTWLLHTLEKPELDGGVLRAADTREGYTGELTCQTLLPKNPAVTVLGGADVFSVNGVCYTAKVLEGDHRNEGGGFRTEISPKTAKTDDTFLHVLGIGDKGKSDVKTVPLDTATHTGALVGGTAVLFGKNYAPSDKPFALTLPAAGAALFVADLLPGDWRVDGAILPVGADGTLYIEKASGKVCFSKV